MNQSPAPEKAFVKLSSWRRAYDSLSRALGVVVPGGDVADIPSGGRSIRLGSGSSLSTDPFTVSSGGRVEGGLVFYGGLIFHLPAERLLALGVTWTIGIEVITNMNLVNHDPDPWSIYIAVNDPPVFRVYELGHIGTHMDIRDLNSASGGTENITVNSGVLFWPLASKTQDGLLQHWSGHLNLEIDSNGRAYASKLYPVEA